MPADDIAAADKMAATEKQEATETHKTTEKNESIEKQEPTEKKETTEKQGATANTAFVENEPVIASSNRFADIEPYTKQLFKADPKLWGQVLPWEFPQNGTQKQEEDFIKKFFSEREIRMQGGSPNGYRFLKQVWYTCALWNINQRLPLVVDWWFRQPKNAVILEDPEMKKYVLRPEAVPSTFFEQKEIDMWGDKFLGIVVKQIQFQIDPTCNNEPPEQPAPTQSEEAPATVPAEASVPFFSKKKASTTAEDDAQAKTAAEVPQPRSSKLAAASPAFQPAQAEEAPGSAPAQFVQAQKPFKATPATGTPPPGFGKAAAPDRRSFSGDAYNGPAQREGPSSKRRGSNGYNKRNSFSGNRQFQRPPTGHETHFQPQSSPYTPHPGQYLGPGIMGAPQGRLPSGGAYDRPQDPMLPTLPQGQPFVYQHPMHVQQAPQQYPPHVPHQFQPEPPAMMGHPGYTQGFLPGGNFGTPVFERRNLSNEQQFSNDARNSQFDNTPNRHSKHRESFSRGAHGRGPKGSIGRGRGSKGKNSFGQPGELMDPNGFKRFTTPMAGHDSRASYNTHVFDPMQMRAPGQNENVVPHGWNRTGDFVPQPQIEPSAGPTEAHRHASDAHPAEPGVTNKMRNYEPLCSHGCAANYIDPNCFEARKLVVFSVSRSAGEHDLKGYFAQFGSLTDAKISKLPPHSQQDKVLAFVTFEHVEGARNCLSADGFPWPYAAPGPHQNLQVQVSKNHWDPKHHSHAPQAAQVYPSASQAPPLPPQQYGPPKAFEPTPPAAPVSALESVKSEEQAQDAPLKSSESTHSLAVQHQESIAGDSTPTASADSSPKKKNRKNGKAKKKSPTQADEGNKGAQATESDQKRQDSIIAPSLQSEKAKSSSLSENPQINTPEKSVELPEVEVSEPANTLPISKADKPEESTSETHIQESTNVDEAVPAEFPVEAEIGEGNNDNEPSSFSDATQEATSKPDEDQNDESFHTASDSPDHIRPNETDEDDVATPTASKDPSTPVKQRDASAGDQAPMIATESGEKEAKTEAIKSPEAQKQQSETPITTHSAKKAPIPQFPKQRNVSIAIPEVETKTTTEANDYGSLKVPEQRSASAGSEVPPSAFVTAPNTPAVPQTEPESPQIPTAQSKTQQKKPAKAKGPEQTESFSIFAKKEKKSKGSKAKKGSIKGKPKLETITSAGPSTAAPSRAVSSASATMPENTAPSTGDEQQPGEVAESEPSGDNNNETTTSIPDVPAGSTASIPDVEAETNDPAPVPEQNDDAKPKADGRQRGGTLSKILGGFMRRDSLKGTQAAGKETEIKEEVEHAPKVVISDEKSDLSVPDASASMTAETSGESLTQPTEPLPLPAAANEAKSQLSTELTNPEPSEAANVEGDENDEAEAVEKGEIGLGISNDATGTTQSKPGNKKKKNKKKKPAKKAQVDTVEMAVPMLDAHNDTPFTTTEGNSEGEAAVQASGRSKGKKPIRKPSSDDDHLVTAPSSRRKLPRRSGAGGSKDTNSTNQPEQDVSVFDRQSTSMPQIIHLRPGSTMTTIHLDDLIEDHFVAEGEKTEEEKAKALSVYDKTVYDDRGASPEVEAARARDREMKAQEEAKKAAKEKAQ